MDTCFKTLQSFQKSKKNSRDSTPVSTMSVFFSSAKHNKMSCTKAAFLNQPLRCSCSNSSSKRNKVVKVNFARLKLPKMVSMPSEITGHDIGVKTIVDGTAFSTTYHAYCKNGNQEYKLGFEYPLRAEIFKHARNDRAIDFVAAQPVYYVAALDLFDADFQELRSGQIDKHTYLLSYSRSTTCDWRDNLSIEQVIFGPNLISELRMLDQW